ncbi:MULTISPECIES: exonuclease SbcCD subunit D [unclassified Crossiella]|uniref:exonuclease SbcCD subunit D n=1 Tax=unclassified Crossiella TaxID=2620835 RepID=UPI001FFF429A|nr:MULTISPECIES: exonuclease SbcCD subunit D [unclassified Crossiella]MCK2237144.1 exonuclease SbcCD subunit D [Crossiella sp. S99.2]MCK2250812.1 exonuclease SbcCD subunit D [Crossiella sp. S99.1]
MRLLHTSDWHVGRTFHGRDLLAEQESVLTGLADVVVDERIDAVLIAGDLYDRAVPSAEAVETCVRILTAIRAAGADIVLISGNHDSAQRLGAFGGFARAGGLHLCTRIATLSAPVLLADAHGPVACYGIPYLDPDPALHALELTGCRGHEAVLGEAMRRIRADLAGRGEGVRSVVLSHAFVVGGEASESERRITVGGVEHVPGGTFSGVDYVALGHLHGPQVLAEHLRYSGSPLAYSFSEARHHKAVWLVELDAHGLAGVQRKALPVPRKLATATGWIDELLTEPDYAELEDCYLSLTLTDPVRPLEAMRRLQQRFPYAVHLDFRPDGGGATQLRYLEAVRGRTDNQIAERFVDDCRGAPPSERELSLLTSAIESVRGREA